MICFHSESGGIFRRFHFVAMLASALTTTLSGRVIVMRSAHSRIRVDSTALLSYRQIDLVETGPAQQRKIQGESLRLGPYAPQNGSGCAAKI